MGELNKKVLVLSFGLYGVNLCKSMSDKYVSLCDLEIQNRKKMKIKSRKEAAILRNMHNKK